jgi:hypothetical protein
VDAGRWAGLTNFRPVTRDLPRGVPAAPILGVRGSALCVRRPPFLLMAGRRRIAKPGEPACGVDGCRRPAGLGTEHVGEGPCLRHSSHVRTAPPTPSPRVEPEDVRDVAPASPEPSPLARRLTDSRSNPSADPLAVLGRVLASARRAGYPFGEAWALGAEAALSYMTSSRAGEWWEALTATERAWADAYAGRDSRLDDLRRH